MRILLITLLLLAGQQGRAQVYDIVNYGAAGDGTTMNTVAIQSAVDACFNAGGGIVKVPAGNFLTATVFLKSNVIISLDSGAIITGSSTTADYPDVFPAIRSYADNYPQRSVFYAEGQHNIGIVGKGTFNGNGFSGSFFADRNNRPYGFRFISCTNVRYEGVKLINSGFWMMHNQNIDTLLIKNVQIINHNTGNGDGFNVDGCRNVLIDSCTADCNDDPIVIKATALFVNSNIVISNCTVGTYSRAIKIGTETNGAFRNIRISNIKVVQSTAGPLTSLAKCGINLSVVDGGSMENVLVENVNMTGIKVPIMIRLGNRGRKYTDTAATPGEGSLRFVQLRNITATASTNVTSSITGIPGSRGADIHLSNIDITYPGGWAALDTDFVVPENIAGGPEATIFGDTLPAAGLYMRHLDNVLLQNVCFHSIQPDGRPDLVADDVVRLDTTASCGVSGLGHVSSNETVLVVYPNPTLNEGWQIAANDACIGATLTLTDASGRILLQQTINSNSYLIPSNNLAGGIYNLAVVSKVGVSSYKCLIKQ